MRRILTGMPLTSKQDARQLAGSVVLDVLLRYCRLHFHFLIVMQVKFLTKSLSPENTGSYPLLFPDTVVFSLLTKGNPRGIWEIAK